MKMAFTFVFWPLHKLRMERDVNTRSVLTYLQDHYQSIGTGYERSFEKQKDAASLKKDNTAYNTKKDKTVYNTLTV